ncbi:hypothetical protein ACFXTI_010262 [Malus domestica]
MMVGRAVWMLTLIGWLGVVQLNPVEAHPHRILVDTDVNVDDVLAFFYLLKQNKTEFDLKAITINTNGWNDAGHAVNYIYDILSVMDRDDIPVGVGGEGGILPNDTIQPNVGGYLPIIDQGPSTAGGCRYRQSIPPGQSGRLDVNTNYGLRKALLPKGNRKYVPLQQPTAQQVMKDAISAGPITVFLMGIQTNFAIFLMTNPQLKKNVKHIYAMGGAVRSTCSGNASSVLCGDIGNLFRQDSDPYGEYNIFGDPFAAYTVLHSGIPVTLVPLDATRTIPLDEPFFKAFEQKQDTFEAQYCFQSLKMVRDTWSNDEFYKEFCIWDAFMVGAALSQMRSLERDHRENEFAKFVYMNLTVITSNRPYGISDGSNPLIDGRLIPKFGVQKNGVHSGHVQMGMEDPFCLVKEGKGKCQDGYTKETTGAEAVSVLVATGAKRDHDSNSTRAKYFYDSFLDVINRPKKTERPNIRTQLPLHESVLHKPDFGKKLMGKALVFDMDMSAGDFVVLLYLLKLPVERINLKGILVSANGWATAATIDVVYDILHMMGRDDIPVGLGNVFAVGQSYLSFTSLGDCTYISSIPQGSGGSLDSDTLYGFARALPSSPRRYGLATKEFPGLGQPTALDVWRSIVKSLDPGSKITLLTNGPLTNLAEIILSENTDSVVQDVYIVGGHIRHDNEQGNLFTVPSNKYAEFNMFLDPLAAKAVFDSKLNITLIPLGIQKQVSSFQNILDKLKLTDSTPEAVFAQHLLSRLWKLKQKHHRYLHMDTYLGEILGAVILGSSHPQLNPTFKFMPLKVVAEGDVSVIGQLLVDEHQSKMVKILSSVNPEAYHEEFANKLGEQKKFAVCVDNTMTMMFGRVLWMLTVIGCFRVLLNPVEAQPRRILVDTDVDTDDVLALLYLLKQSKTEFDLTAISVNVNGWSDAGHAVNYLYDILAMMDRNDIPVGVGGEGGILPNGTILPNVGGYLPLIDQGDSTAGGCRYKQAVPPGQHGHLDINTNYGVRRALLPQGDKKYVPLQQPTAQQVMKDAISAGPITVLIMGTHSNLAVFLMTNPSLKKNIEHIYAMGGAVRSNCSENATSVLCGDIGNLFRQDINPYAEFNIFGDPFAAYTVLHSGIPVTLVPLDATRTIPLDEPFFKAFEQKQDTYEAQYSFQSLKMVRDTWPNDEFYKQFCMWDSFMVGVALSQMRSSERDDKENEFAKLEYMNLTVITSNIPYGISDGSNPLIDGRLIPKFGVQKKGVHSGHVQMGMEDPFCLVKEGKGKCQDGYTKETAGAEAVTVLVATEAKRDHDSNSTRVKDFNDNFLDVINRPKKTGRPNIRTQLPLHESALRKPDFGKKLMGKNLVFDMDMSAGDFLALLYLLKLPVERINLKGILVNANGWATAATIDVVYDILHMMGRDDIPVGLGNVFAVGQSYSSFSSLGDCTYISSIPQGSGGSLDSDTLYGFARALPRSPRRYRLATKEFPGLGQPTAIDVWKSIVKSLDPGSKITLLTNGPLTNLAEILLSENADSMVQDVYIVGGHIRHGNEQGNLFTVPSNKYAEFNMFLDPLAAKAVLDSKLNITLISLGIQKQVSSFQNILDKLNLTDTTPEAVFARDLLSRLWKLKQKHDRYRHMDTFLGEIIGAVILGNSHPQLNPTFKFMPLKVVAVGDVSVIGQLLVDEHQSKMVKILSSVNPKAYHEEFANILGEQKQSAS